MATLTSPLSQEQQQQQQEAEKQGQQEQQEQQHQHQHQQQELQQPPQHPSASIFNTAKLEPNSSPTAVTPMDSIHADTTMVGGDSIDDIIRNNRQELQRRRSSIPQPFPAGVAGVPSDPPGPTRRMSVIEFGSVNPQLHGFQFGSQGLPSEYQNLGTALAASGQIADYSPPAMIPIPPPGSFIDVSPDITGTTIMPDTFPHLSMDHMNQGTTPPISLFPQVSIPGPYDSASAEGALSVGFDMGINMSPVGPGETTTPPQPPPPQPPQPSPPQPQPTAGGGGDMRIGVAGSQPDTSTSAHTTPVLLGPDHTMSPFHTQQPVISSGPPAQSSTIAGSYGSCLQVATQGVTPPLDSVSPQSSTPPVRASSGTIQGPHVFRPPSVLAKKASKSIYSKSGFDCVTALTLVSTRKHPEINLGVVDLSCAFVICDITMNDCPIIYVSPNFQNLTGYSSHEIVGKNCRFLQSPDGKVEAGTRREFVDDGAVYNLKVKISEGREVQQSLINYRKGGKPFLNLLTMIPIPWDTEEIRYVVGFQIDIVEAPDALAADQEAGGMLINYKPSDIGQYAWTPPRTNRWSRDNGQTLGVDDVSNLLNHFQPKEGLVSEWHKQSWDKMLLENADDLVHVVTLKGIFLYVSPACKHILEYDASELVNTSIADICNPSDFTAVSRDLRELTVASPTVSTGWRARRKQSGYVWLETFGSLYVDPGRGRKVVILIGRPRPTYSFSQTVLDAQGGVGDSDLWSKMSTAGMFLFVSSNVRSLLDLQPESLMGTSIQDMMRKESRPEFGRAIEKARRGVTVTCKHEVQNRRGQVLQAQTTLYPGDTEEGVKPSFLVAQTKLLKASSRSAGSAAASTTTGTTTKTAASIASDTVSSIVYSGPAGQVVEEAGGGGSGSGGSGSIGRGGGSSGGPGVAGTASETSAGSVSSPPTAQDKAQVTDSLFDELSVVRPSSWHFELRLMEKDNRALAEELVVLLANRKRRKRRKGVGNMVRDCANCHTPSTPEWRRGPSGQRDLCNSCGLRWAKQIRQEAAAARSRPGDSQQSKSEWDKQVAQASARNYEPGGGGKPSHTSNNQMASGRGRPTGKESAHSYGRGRGGGGNGDALGRNSTSKKKRVSVPMECSAGVASDSAAKEQEDSGPYLVSELAASRSAPVDSVPHPAEARLDGGCQMEMGPNGEREGREAAS